MKQLSNNEICKRLWVWPLASRPAFQLACERSSPMNIDATTHEQRATALLFGQLASLPVGQLACAGVRP